MSEQIYSEKKRLSVGLRFLIGALLLLGSWKLASYWMANRPRARRQPPAKEAVLVEVITAVRSEKTVTVTARGTVLPARSLELTSRLAGELVRTASEFFPGGFVPAGELVAEIDRTDYEIAAKEARLAIKKAEDTFLQSELTIEREGLALKESQLKIEQSDLTIAQNSLEIEQSTWNIEQSLLSIKQSRLAITEREADVARVEKDLKLELGQQEVARYEFANLDGEITESGAELLLRKPQFKSAKAALAAAQARLQEAEVALEKAEFSRRQALTSKKQAEAVVAQAQANKRQAELVRERALNNIKAAESAKNQTRTAKQQAELGLERALLALARTRITSPFDAVIAAKKSERGALLNPGSPIATLVDTSEYWVELVVPLDLLSWFAIPTSAKETGATVRLFHEEAWGSDVFRVGEVKRLLTSLEVKDRMTRVLVAVDDPLALANQDKPAMILGAYLRAEIVGKKLSGVFQLSPAIVHDQDWIWVMKPDMTLDIRRIETVWRDQESVCVIAGLEEGESVVVSDLATPVAGMSLRLMEENHGQ